MNSTNDMNGMDMETKDNNDKKMNIENVVEW